MNLGFREENKFKIISDFLDKSAVNFPSKIALIYEDRSYNYRELKEKSDRITNFVLENTDKEDVVGILIQNAPDFLISYFGILRTGRAVLLLPVNVSDQNLSLQIEKVEPSLFFSEEKFLEKLSRVGVNGSKVFLTKEVSSDETLTRFSTVVTTVLPENVSTIIFTSGTTGEPKGIKLRHKNVVGATLNIIKYLQWDFSDVDVNVASLAHSFGIGNVHCVFAVGGTSIVFSDGINIKGMLGVIKKYKATTLSLTPATLRMIVSSTANLTESSLRFVQTNMSKLEKDLVNKMIKNLPNIDFHYYYGLTEASRSTFITLNRHPDKLDSVGRPSPNVEIKVVNENDDLLSAMEVGEICIKGNMVIEEYLDEQETKKRIRNGWLYTNDFGYLNEEGYLYITGRKDDIINVSGEKVNPEEVEAVIKRVPGVKDVVVIGLPDRLLGEVVSAFVVADTDSFDIQNVVRECRKTLESYKVPRKVSLTARIPKTDNGKVQRTLFKKMIINHGF